MTSPREAAQATRAVSERTAKIDATARAGVLRGIAECLEAAVPIIQMMNSKDVQAAKAAGLTEGAAGRLRITGERVTEVVAFLREVAASPDPLEGGLRRPRGVVLVVDHVDPLGIIRAFALCFMAGNGSILCGHALARESSITLMKFIHAVLVGYELPTDVCLVPYNATAEELADLFTAGDLIDIAVTLGEADLNTLAAGHAAMPLVIQPASAPRLFADGSPLVAFDALTQPHGPPA